MSGCTVTLKSPEDVVTALTGVTVVVSERESPYPPVAPWPLIYDLDVDLSHWHNLQHDLRVEQALEKEHAISRLAAISVCRDRIAAEETRLKGVLTDMIAWERINEIGVEDDDDPDEIRKQIAKGLEVHFMWVGQLPQQIDWRE